MALNRFLRRIIPCSLCWYADSMSVRKKTIRCSNLYDGMIFCLVHGECSRIERVFCNRNTIFDTSSDMLLK